MARVIAEIGCNHMGDLQIAKEMIKTAAEFCRADFVKFQKRHNRELLTEAEYNAAHPNPVNSFGETYGLHREFLEFSREQHRELKEYCESLGVGYSTSVWDVTSAREMAALKPEFLKVPSACNLDFDLLGILASEFPGDLHISLGMTEPEEIEQIVSFLEKNRAASRSVLYACTSGYPVGFDEVCLLEIQNLQERYRGRVRGIAFSGHHLGIAIDIAALTLGATWIERHFTLDRTLKGTDHAASLEPDGLRRLVRDVRAVTRALKSKDAGILAVEKPQRQKLKRLSSHVEHARNYRRSHST